jgi:hypothetical protein
VVDSDQFTKNLFTLQEWSEISTTNCDPLPELPESTMRHLDSFDSFKILNMVPVDANLPIVGKYTSMMSTGS